MNFLESRGNGITDWAFVQKTVEAFNAGEFGEQKMIEMEEFAVIQSGDGEYLVVEKWHKVSVE